VRIKRTVLSSLLGALCVALALPAPAWALSVSDREALAMGENRGCSRGA
jgi:hypothetical protein